MISSTCVLPKPQSDNTSSLSFLAHLNPTKNFNQKMILTRVNWINENLTLPPTIFCGLRELRSRIETVKTTQKVTEAMKLVAAAKVRRAQEAVVNGRPFAEALTEFLYNVHDQMQLDDVDVPLTTTRPVRKVGLVVITGERGLCGSFNSGVLRKAEARINELKNLGLDYTVISVGKKGNAYFRRRNDFLVDRFVGGGEFPTTKEAQVIADDVFSLFVSEEVDKVEILYTKFVSLIKSDPVIRTLLPLSSKGAVYDLNGNCYDATSEDETFRLTTKEGKLIVERDHLRTKGEVFLPNLQFEQDPAQILDALMPLYLNSQILRALQESFASELASRMNSMSKATDNAVELKKNLSIAYNRERQAKITGEILEEQKDFCSEIFHGSHYSFLVSCFKFCLIYYLFQEASFGIEFEI